MPHACASVVRDTITVDGRPLELNLDIQFEAVPEEQTKGRGLETFVVDLNGA